MKNYTEQAKAHINSLIADGLSKSDIFLRYTANRVTIVHPAVENGKAKLVKVVFKAPKAPKAEAQPVVAQAQPEVIAQAPAGVQG